MILKVLMAAAQDDESPLTRLQRAFGTRDERGIGVIAICLFGAILLAIVAWVVYHSLLRPYWEERRLFGEIASASGLNGAEIGALWRAARAVSRADPMRVLISPRLLDEAAKRIRLPDAARTSIAARLYS